MRALLEKHRREGNAFPLIGGHRGCSCQYQENSLQAMEEGIARGADYLEIDVQLTKDDVPIIFHDINVTEKTGLSGYVQEHTYKEMRDAYQVPTLSEAMEWGRKAGAYFALELKSYPSVTEAQNLRMMPILNDVVTSCHMEGQVEAFGLDYVVLERLKRCNPAFDIGLIVPFVPKDPVELMRSMDAMVYLTYVYNLTQDAILHLQKAGYYVSGAILKSQSLMDYAVSCHVDMFEYDYPERIKRK